MIDKNTSIEDLIEKYPAANTFLMQKGIRCIACGEPIWGTLEEAIKEKGFTEKEMNEIIKELIDHIK